MSVMNSLTQLACAVAVALILPAHTAAQQAEEPRRDPPPVQSEPRSAEPRRTPPPDRAEPRAAEPRRDPPQGQRERRTEPRRPTPPPVARPMVAARGEWIFIGGYFYDPFVGPYPWWPRPVQHPWYFPVYDYRAELRLIATPREAAVYVDGYYAGIVDDFDGLFQRLLLPPGGHVITLHQLGYRTASFNLYLRSRSTMKLHHAMEPLPSGAVSEPPPQAPPVPPPPPGSYRLPRTPAPSAPPATAAPVVSAVGGRGTLELHVQPPDAEVRIDGGLWMSSAPGSFVIDLPIGSHRLQIVKAGYVSYAADIDLREGETTPVNIVLSSAPR